MAEKSVVMAAAKVMIAAAWVDGQMTNDELNSLKDLLFRIPELTASDWVELEIYMETPVGEAERERLVADLQQVLVTARDKELVQSALSNVIAADGVVTKAEQEAVDAIQAAIEAVDVGVFARLSRFVSDSISSQSEAVAGAPNREDYLEDFIKNRVYYNVRQRLHLEDMDLNLSDTDLRRVGLAGGMMAKVARVSPEVTETEFEAVVEALQSCWDLDQTEATFIAEVATVESSAKMDTYRLAREFFEAFTYEERLKWLDVLFSVAAADGHASTEEMEEIRLLSRILKLSHREFITAKLKLPPDQR